MKKIFLLTISFVAILTQIACKKFLNVKPDQALINDSAMTTSKDLKAVLDGAYDGLQSTDVAGGNFAFFGDLMSDDCDVLSNKLSNFGTSEIYNGQTSVQIGALSEMWKQCYSVINRANNIIYTIDKGTIKENEFEKVKFTYKAEAFMLRAYAQYILLQFWALPYEASKKGSNTQDGIVLRTSPTLSGPDGLNKARSTVEESYAQVLSDLKNAESFFALNGPSVSVNRFSLQAARAMIARVSLITADYSQASSYAQLVINSNQFALSGDSSKFLTLYQQNGNNLAKFPTLPETICQLVNISTDNAGAHEGYYNINSFLYVKNETYALYSTGDDRAGKLLQNFGRYFSLKYRRPSGASVSNNIILFRLSELYLILAEAEARLSGSVSLSAVDALNKLRQRNLGFEYTPFAPAGYEELIQEILLERRLEMLTESADRYITSRRLGLPLRDGSNNYSKYLFKIPQEEMSSNNLIIQN